MTELLTAAQMRSLEQAAIDSGEVTGLELMERAGQGVVDAILDWRPELATTSHRAVVLCGPGNNGGDGFVVARLLHQRGWEVEVLFYGDEEKLPPDARTNFDRWWGLGDITVLDDDERAIYNAHGDLFVDALFGLGLSAGRRLPWAVAAAMSRMGGEHGDWPYYKDKIVSIDVPSCLCSDSGRSGLTFFNDTFAALTVTFHMPKLGHCLGDGPTICGALRVVDIGLADRAHMELLSKPMVASSLNAATNLLDAQSSLPKTVYPVPERVHKWPQLHKYSHGHALILSGGPGKGGAARLAARGALRIGAGLVTVGCPSEALTENAARLDAIMLAEIESADALSTELEARKVKALCIGPGFGMGAWLRSFIDAGLKPGLPMVLDADALTEFREDPETLFDMLHEKCVLTPHEGEFGRLFPDILAKLKEPATRGPAYSKVDATREAAKRAGCVVLFKGADTVIADPDGRCSINSAHYERLAPWLATAGSGDVLAGFITGLLARGFAPMQAAETAAWLHVECALKFGPGLIAEDLPEQLPAVFRDLDL